MNKDREIARAEMNEWGRQSRPFIFIIDFEENECQIHPLDSLPNHIFFDIQGSTNRTYPSYFSRKVIFNKYPISFANYKKKFDQVMSELKYGNTFLINLTAKTKIETNLNLLDIFDQTSANYKLYIENRCVVFSPESFIQINDGIIASYPMKGTIDADLSDAYIRLSEDPKEIAEHFTIVDLIRNDISIFASEVSLVKFRYVDHLQTNEKNLLQLSSHITGKLWTDYHHHIGDILFSMLPAGSISGAPKAKTIDIIKIVEGESRGYYTGVFGLFDGKNVDSGVMIRYIEKNQDQLYYRSGGGITHQSIARNEYKELIDKVYLPIK